MPDLPSGTVTFLFTDIEGSTALWEQHRDAMRQALVRHDALVEQIVTEHGGNVVRPRGEGDSCFAVFARATDAVATAAALQQALYIEPWPTPNPLRVRMALHTGEADLREGDYYGSAVNRCARLRAVAHGGQTLVSLATEQLVRGQLSTNLSLRDLGEHRLKDLQHAERVFDLAVAAIPGNFPTLRSLDARPNNLPVQRDQLIGREQEVAAVVALLRRPEIGLVTLTGPGGTGKTRLSQQVAAEVLEELADGVWFVDLAPLSDPGLVPSTIASALGVVDVGGQSIVETLRVFLRAKHLLLVLDNFEQVVAAAPFVGDLLNAARKLRVLVTSRIVLHIYREQEYPVPPLALPDLTQLPPLAALNQYAAIALFSQRAQAVKPDFQVTKENAAAVADICVRLDGLPLAIELAAARVKLFAPQALLARLDQRLTILKGGARDLPARQQTLRGAIDWSYDLLNPTEQTLFRRLGVFVGGWTLEAPQAVCDADGKLGLDVFDGLQSLLDQSLLQQADQQADEPRFTMLATIREYALEQLARSGEAEALQRQHAAYYLALAEQAEAAWQGPAHATWVARLETEHDNLRAVLMWSRTAQGDAAYGMRVAGALWLFWMQRGYYSEGLTWLMGALEQPSEAAPPAARAKALFGAAALAQDQGDYAQSNGLLEESLRLSREVGDKPGMAWASLLRGRNAQMQGEYHLTGMLEESLILFEEIGDRPGIIWALLQLGIGALEQGDVVRAAGWFQDALTRAQDLGDSGSGASALMNLGLVAEAQGEDARAATLYRESLARFRDLGDPSGIVDAVLALGHVAQAQGQDTEARARYRESLALAREIGLRVYIPACLEAVAGITAHQGQAAAGARLFGAAEVLREAIGHPLRPIARTEYDRAVAAVRAQLDEAAFTAAWAEGRAMSLEQAIAYALEETG